MARIIAGVGTGPRSVWTQLWAGAGAGAGASLSGGSSIINL
jgi:hypothetical protein